MQFTTLFEFFFIFIISDVIPLFVLRKKAIFSIEFCPFLVTRTPKGGKVPHRTVALAKQAQ